MGSWYELLRFGSRKLDEFGEVECVGDGLGGGEVEVQVGREEGACEDEVGGVMVGAADGVVVSEEGAVDGHGVGSDGWGVMCCGGCVLSGR